MTTPLRKIERVLERALFASRWVMAPLYVGLSACLVLVLLKFAQKAFALVLVMGGETTDELILGVLSLVDLSLVGNLLVMVIFAGYENFVTKFDLADDQARPDWMGHTGFAELKLKLMASIVAISAIHVLEDFMHVDTATDRELAWGLGIHFTFVISGLLLAVMDRVSERG